MAVKIIIGDAAARLHELPDASVRCVVTSPPYFGLRDYGIEGQIGLETSIDDYLGRLVSVFREVRRVLADDGTLWLNLGDAYASNIGGGQGKNGQMADRSIVASRRGGQRPQGMKSKDLMGIPWRVAFALQADGWYLRQDIIWHKPNPMPESVTDRCTKAHEYLFLLSKSQRYYFDQEAIKEPCDWNPDDTKMPDGWDTGPGGQGTTRNKRSVWTVSTRPYAGAHFATFPPALIEPCIRAGSAVGDTVLDPFAGSGTTGYVAHYLQRSAVLVELNAAYEALIRERFATTGIFNPLECA